MFDCNSYTTVNFTNEFRSVSVTLICRAWLAGRGRCTESRSELETVKFKSLTAARQ